jgi:HK97 family phage major capsid protein
MVVSGLLGTASEINGQGSEVLAATDPFDLQNALGARFSANATFQSHIATMNVYRQFETTNGALQFPESRDNPSSLLGKGFYENSNMDSVLNAAATENNYADVYEEVFLVRASGMDDPEAVAEEMLNIAALECPEP